MRRHLFLAAAAMALVAEGAATAPPRIAIIIDDLGYQLEAGERAIDLPGPLAFAILPNTPSGRRLAQRANAQGKEVLLHLPLEAVDREGPRDPGGIVLEMSRTELHAAFADALASVPYVVGVSSHRGSLLTRHPGHMAWLMSEIADQEHLFFVDSYTTPASVALRIAAEQGVSATRRDVFLDHDRDPAAIGSEFERLKGIARERGHAVGIGHPYPETLAMLEHELPALGGDGIELVTISELLH